jgi:hypothetical protein
MRLAPLRPLGICGAFAELSRDSLCSRVHYLRLPHRQGDLELGSFRRCRVQFSTVHIATNQVVRSSSLSVRTNPRAIILKGGRVVFNTKANDYRLIIVVVEQG